MLDHIEKIGELGDLAGVEPTSHVIAVENALRADEPRPSLPRRGRAGERAGDATGAASRSRAPARPRHERRALPHGRRGGRADPRRRAGRRRAVARLPRPRRRGRAERLHVGGARGRRAGGRRREPAGRRPVAVKDLFCTAGRARARPARRSSRATARPTRPRASPGWPAPARRCWARPTRTSSRWAPRRSTPRSGRRATRGTARACRAAPRADRPPPSPPGSAPWAIGTDTGGSIRQPAALCGIVGLKPTYGAVSRYGMIAFASSLDQAGPFTRDVTDAALLLGAMAGQDPCDSTSVGLPGPVELPGRSDLRGVRLGVPGGADRRGHRAGRARVVQRDARPRPRARRDRRAVPPPARAPRARRLLPDRAGRGLLEPRPLRRRALRLPRRGRRDLLHMYTETREQGFGAEVKRRIMLGTYALSSGYYDAYYGRAQQVRTLISRDFAPPGSGSTSSPRRRLRRWPSSWARSSRTRWRCT